MIPGWAVLAAGALVASILAVGAAPAAAGEQQQDARSEWLACVGAAKAGNGFTDVAMDSVHYDSISCLSYYGITTGKTADTYNPGDDVTRSQMALFLTRAADKADIDLGDAMDMGFTDLDMTGADRVAAINVLASKGIMPGRTATTFDPEGLVTRGDMAQHLFTLLDLALDSVHIDRLPRSADGDGTGIEVNVANGQGMRPNDYFGDVRRTQPAALADMINAVYELGVTTGKNNVAGENGVFDPDGEVTRAQMASFIMRAMGHTNLRPEGLTAQQTTDDTQISVRDADFKPVVDQRVELISSHFPDDAFNRSGRCITSPAYVLREIGTVNTTGFDACSIDLGDERTDASGNVDFDVGSATGSRFTVTCTASTQPAGGGTFRFIGTPGTPATVWAWQGDMGDAVDRSTDLVEAVDGNAANPGRATQATISGGTRTEVKMGDTLTYEIQLRNVRGMPVGPSPGVNHDYLVTVAMTAEDAGIAASGTARDYTRGIFTQTTVQAPDGSGKITIPIRYPDPTPYAPIPANANDSDVEVIVTVTPGARNTLPLVDRTLPTATVTGNTVAAASEVFSDNAPAPNGMTAVSEPWRLRSSVSSRNRNSIAVTVLDQYGDPHGSSTTVTYQVAPTDSSTPTDFQDAGTPLTYTIPASGRRTITYVHDGTGPLTQTVEIALQDAAGSAVNDLAGTAIARSATNAVVVQWADRATSPGTSAAARSVLVGDPRSNFIVIADVGGDPAALEYGPDDNFFVEGAVVTLGQFEEVLGSFGTKATDPISSLGNLEWARYDYNRPRDGATWDLSGLGCRPSAATR